VFGILSAWVDR